MIKKLIFAVAAMIAMMGLAFAQVDVNKADKAALDAVKGIGPVLSKTIIDERTKAGPFKDWADFQARVKGVADKKAEALSGAGLQVNGQARAAAASAASKASSASAASAASKASKASAASAASAASMASAASAASKASMASAASAASKASMASAASAASKASSASASAKK